MLGLDIANMHAKCDHIRFSHSGDMFGAQQDLNCSHDLTMPLSGMVCHPGLAFATINLPTKFEVSISTHYEDMKGDTKYRKLGYCMAL